MGGVQIAVTVLTTVLASTGLWSFISARMEKRDKTEKQLVTISQTMETLNEKVDKNSAVLARTHILRFSDEVSNGVIHSQEYWRQTLEDIDTYELFCSSHPKFRNSYCVASINFITNTYEKLLEKGEFSN